MTHSLKVKDAIGEITITYEDMCRYHGKDFLGGVALAFKALELAFRKIAGGQPPERRKIRLVLGFNPPGVIDGLEFVTRAITQQRVVIDPTVGIGPKSTSGTYYFEVHYGDRGVAMWLKDGLLPADFYDLAVRGLSGAATADELKRWHDYKIELGTNMMEMDAADVLEVREISGS